MNKTSSFADKRYHNTRGTSYTFSDEPLKAEIVQIEVEDGFTNLTI